MGTRNNPGAHDCYANAEPDEPMFVLLGRDPIAFNLVQLWAGARELVDLESSAKTREAEACAKAMLHWAHMRNKDTIRAAAALAVAAKIMLDTMPPEVLAEVEKLSVDR